MGNKVFIYDTTLRDGSQAEEVNFSPEDKIRIARKLDEIGIDYIEGGWPSSNPTDENFFKDIKNYEFKHSKIAAFGSTHHPKLNVNTDDSFKKVLDADTDVITLVGKSWDIHVKEALKTTLDRNLEIIYDSIKAAKNKAKEVFFDAEHFFDGYKENKEYTMACIKKAYEAGSDCIVLCDTNGGCLTMEIKEIIEQVLKEFPEPEYGIHVHNDAELAVANTIVAVNLGIRHVQGTINGYGERCGNANLCSIIPNLELKMGLKCLPEGNLKKLTSLSRFVAEIANLSPFKRQPYVGESAFAHKGGIHVSAIMSNPRTYEHIPPEKVGNRHRVLLSDLAGKSNIIFKAKQFGLNLKKEDPIVLELLEQIKNLEMLGYEFSVAEASFELLLYKTLGKVRKYYELIGFRVLDAMQKEIEEPISEATVMVRVGGMLSHTAATGKGPVNALDNALRKALEGFYPNLKEMKLLDFKVRVLTPKDPEFAGTASMVRVFIESGDQKQRWITVGVSYNIIEASWKALQDSVIYKLFKDDREKGNGI